MILLKKQSLKLLQSLLNCQILWWSIPQSENSQTDILSIALFLPMTAVIRLNVWLSDMKDQKKGKNLNIEFSGIILMFLFFREIEVTNGRDREEFGL